MLYHYFNNNTRGRCAAQGLIKTMSKIYFIAKFSLMCFGFPFAIHASGQDLPIIAVTDITASVDSSRYLDFKNSKASNFQTMLETQLVKIGRFKIVERERIDQVLEEQALQGNFSGTDRTLAIGEVDYVVFGSVTRFGSTKTAVSTRGISTVRSLTEFGVDLKIVDALNGEIRRAETVNVNIESGLDTKTGGVATSERLADPLSEVQRRAAKKVAATIAESIFPIEVLTFREDTQINCCVYLNYGDAILSKGDILKIVESTEELIDPATGLNLGSVEKTIGQVEITEALERLSKAKIIAGEIPEKGQIAKIIRDSPRRSQSVDLSQQKRIGREL